MAVQPPLRIETVDWFTLIWGVIKAGHSLADIERRTGISSSTLRGYLDGSQPPHWRGELLIELWLTELDKPRDDLPMTKLSLAPRVVHSIPQVRDTGGLADLEDVWRRA